MHKNDSPSIFAEYYRHSAFVDRYETDTARAVDVIIPIIHTNELWRSNLLSIYREIPVRRLILGDGGCIDDSLDVAREFPRVEVLDHRDFTSLGFSLRRLIEATETEWFVYLHSDVYLPEGWFDTMSANRENYDWFECNQRITVLADYLFDTTAVERSYSGSQMGRRSAFEAVTPLIDDDYLYRNEDIVLARLVERTGGRYGKIGETHHFHQVMFKPSRWHRAIKSIAIKPDIGRDEDVRANRTYALGIIKYLDLSEASDDLVLSVNMAIDRLAELGEGDPGELHAWVADTSPGWAAALAAARGPGLPPVDMSARARRRRKIGAVIHRFADAYVRLGLFGTIGKIVSYIARKIGRLFAARAA